MIGVKVYETKREAAELCREWKQMGINTVFASASLNLDRGFRQAARQAGIARFVILPVFYDPDALKADPSLHALTADGERAVEEWVEFVCPSREAFRRRKIESRGVVFWSWPALEDEPQKKAVVKALVTR